MINELNQAVDDLYQGKNISDEMMKIIGPAAVKELVIRARGWEIEQEQQES